MSNNPSTEQSQASVQVPASDSSSGKHPLLTAALIILCIITVFSAFQNKHNYDKSKNLAAELEKINETNKAALAEFEAKAASVSEKLIATEKSLQEKDASLANALKERTTAENARINAEKALQDNKDNLAILEKTTAEMEKRFQISSARDVKLLGLTFEQPVESQADRTLVSQIASSLSTKTPAALKAACEKALSSRMSIARVLSFNAANGCVSDGVAGIVEAVAKASGLKAATRFSWDLDRKTFRVTVTITDPANKNPDAEMVFGGKVSNESTYQVSPKSTVFPFTSINLMSNAERVLFERSGCIPLGGAYIHYYRVFSKGAWNLEYEFPANVEPDSVNMNLLMLTPGVAASSSIANGRMKFHFAANGTETTFLLFADKPFFPLRASLQLNQ